MFRSPLWVVLLWVVFAACVAREGVAPKGGNKEEAMLKVQEDSQKETVPTVQEDSPKETVPKVQEDSPKETVPKVTVSTLAGSGKGDNEGRRYADGPGSTAKLGSPVGIAVDASGNLYVADALNHRIRKITPEGEVSTFAGSGGTGEKGGGYADGPGSEAKFNEPSNITIDAAGNLYVVDDGGRDNGNFHHRIRKITPKGEVSTLVGGRAFYKVSGIAADATGNLYVTDSLNHCIYKVTPKGKVSKFAGKENLGRKRGDHVDGPGNTAEFFEPSGIAIDAAGNLYVADMWNHRIRKVTPKGQVSTLAGSGRSFYGGGGYADGPGKTAKFRRPFGMTIDAAGNLYVVDHGNHRIRKITPEGKVSTLAGSGKSGFSGGGYVDGPGNVAKFNEPASIAIDASGNLYVAESPYIRKVTPQGEVSTFAGTESSVADGPGSEAEFEWPSGLAIDTAGNLYVADSESNRIRKVTPEGEVSTLALREKRESGYADDTESAAEFDGPTDIAIDKAGNLYVTDKWNNRIRKVTPQGEVSTFAGSGREGYADGKGSVAKFMQPSGIAIDAAGNLYVADTRNNCIRKVTPKGEVSTFVGNSAWKGHRGYAYGLFQPSSLAIDASDNLYVADEGANLILKITPKGKISTFADNNAVRRGYADGKGSAAKFDEPSGLAIDAAGNLYVADSRNNRIRKLVFK